MDIDFISALSGLVGTVLIFIFGLPPRVDPEGHQHLILEEIDNKEIAKAKRYKYFSYLGLGLIGLSFLLQMTASINSGDDQPGRRPRHPHTEYRF